MIVQRYFASKEFTDEEKKALADKIFEKEDSD